MKRILFALAMLGGLLPLGSPVDAALPLTYVSVSTFTPGGSGTKAWALQNTSASLDVRILKLEVSNATNGTVAGGLMQFWLYGSTVVIPGGVSQVSFYDHAAANTSAPSYVSVSTGPAGVVYEGKQNRQLPLYRPFIINDDETAAANFKDEFQQVNPAEATELLLPRGSNRAVVLEQQQFGATDFTAGTVMVRVVYTVK